MSNNMAVAIEHVVEETTHQNRIIADMDYWETLKEKTLLASSQQKWLKRLYRDRMIYKNRLFKHLQRWDKKCEKLLSIKNNN